MEDALRRIDDHLEKQDAKLDTIKEMVIRHDTHMTGLLGNGQPGRITVMEATIDDLKHDRDKAKGWIAGILFIGTVLGWAGHFAIDLFSHAK